MPPAASRPRAALWPLGLLVAVLVGVPVVGLVRDALDRGPGRFAVGEAPTSYHVVYRVEDRSGPQVTVTTERLWVRRPFEGRLEVAEGPPPGGATLATTVSRLGFVERRSAAGGGVVLAAEPVPPEGDVRLDAVVADALETGLVEGTSEEAEVLERTCRVVRVEDQGADIARRLCVDRTGIPLAEERVLGGRTVQRRVAVSLDLRPALEDRLFAVEDDPLPIDRGGGGFKRLSPSSRLPDVRSYELVRAPAGFRSLGRFLFSPPTPPAEPALPRVPRQASVLQVWTRGPAFLVVENGGTANFSEAFGDEGRAVRLGRLGTGRLVVGLGFSEVRVSVGEGRFVRVRGTLPADRLLALTRSLQPRRGGSLQPGSPPPPAGPRSPKVGPSARV